MTFTTAPTLVKLFWATRTDLDNRNVLTHDQARSYWRAAAQAVDCDDLWLAAWFGRQAMVVPIWFDAATDEHTKQAADKVLKYLRTQFRGF